MKADTPMTAEPFLPPRRTLPALRRAVQGCRGCPLYRDATQAVFGEGPVDAAVMIVGEVPGDDEDLAGHPFVGPAGKLLDRALHEVGIERADVYVTNAVKHFKFERRGKRRLHDKPDRSEVMACKPWLLAELDVVHPRMLVALGATAAQSLFGADFRVTKQRGLPIKTEIVPWAIATVHPSSLLRIPGSKERREAYAEFVGDLKVVADHAKALRR